MKFPSRSVEINLCGQFPIPCGNKSFRAAIFRFVRVKFNPCGHKSIGAAKSRFVRVLWHFSLKKGCARFK
jgi:hypothetical protein